MREERRTEGHIYINLFNFSGLATFVQGFKTRRRDVDKIDYARVMELSQNSCRVTLVR